MIAHDLGSQGNQTVGQPAGHCTEQRRGDPKIRRKTRMRDGVDKGPRRPRDGDMARANEGQGGIKENVRATDRR